MLLWPCTSCSTLRSLLLVMLTLAIVSHHSASARSTRSLSAELNSLRVDVGVALATQRSEEVAILEEQLEDAQIARNTPTAHSAHISLIGALKESSGADAIVGPAPRRLTAKTPMYISVMLPYTGGWPGGLGIHSGVVLMFDAINRNPDMLPDYDLRPVYQDDECDRAPALRLFLKNNFDSMYEQATLHRNGTITKEEVFRKVVAIMGPGCSGAAQELCAFNGAARIPLVSGTASSPILADRKRFPYFWRTMASDTASLTCYCYLAITLGHRRVGSVTGNLLLFSQWSMILANLIAETGIDATAMPEMTVSGHDGAPVNVFEMAESTATYANAAVRLLKASKLRVVFTATYETQLRLVTCSAYKLKYDHVIWISFGWQLTAWWLVDQAGVTCSKQEMALASRYYVAAGAEMWRADSDTRLDCAPDMTAAEMKTAYTNRPPVLFRSEAAPGMDGVCMIARVLHEFMYNPKAPYTPLGLDQLTKQTKATFLRFHEAFQNTHFEGVTGTVKFAHDNPDPLQTILIEQFQERSFDGSLPVMTPVAGYKDGVITWRAPFEFWGETFFPVGSDLSGPLDKPLPSFRNCSAGEDLDMTRNVCKPCPIGTEFVPAEGACSPCSPGSSRSNSSGTKCVKCARGMYQSEAGQTQCVACLAGSYCPVIGLEEPPICPAGSYCPAGSKDASLCPSGSYKPTLGGAREEDCLPCEKGSASRSDGSAACAVCPAGTYSAGGLTASECIPCPLSSWSGNNSMSCSNCPVGFVTLGVQSPGIEFCTCPENSVWLPPGSPAPEGVVLQSADSTAGRCVPCGANDLVPEGVFYSGLVCPGGFACKAVVGKRLPDDFTCPDSCVGGPTLCATQCVVPLQNARVLCESAAYMRDCDGWTVRTLPKVMDALDELDASGATGKRYSWANVAILGKVAAMPGFTAQESVVDAEGWSFFPQIKHCRHPSLAVHQPPLAQQGFYVTYSNPLVEGPDAINANRSLDAVYNTSELATALSPSQPLFVFRCQNPKACPGGGALQCFPGDGGLACSACAEAHYTTQNGCAKCLGENGASVLVLVMVVAACEIGLFGMYLLTDHPLSAKVAGTMATALALSNTVNGLQTFTVFRMLSMNWPAPLGELIDALKIFMLDLDALQWECVATVNPVTKFSVKLLTPAFFAGSYFCLLLLSKMIPAHSRWSRGRMMVPHTVNCIGVILQMLFISICLGLIIPFKCRNNPAGIATLFDFPSVVCGSDDHQSLSTLGALFLFLYPGLFFAGCGYVIRILPRVSVDNPNVLRYVKFLVGRFRPDRYYFGVFFLARNLLLGIAPLVDPSNALVQCVALGIVLIAALFCQLILWPWAVPLVNWMDTFTLACFTIAVVGAAGLSGASNDSGVTEQGQPIVTIMTMVFITVFASMTLVVLAIIVGTFVEKRRGAPWESRKRKLMRLDVAAQLLQTATSISTWKASSSEALVAQLSSYDLKALNNALEMLSTVVHMDDQSTTNKGPSALRLTVSKVFAKRRSSLMAASGTEDRIRTSAGDAVNFVGHLEEAVIEL